MYTASQQRYDIMLYHRSGRSGVLLPAITVGLWHNFGPDCGHVPRKRGGIAEDGS